MRNHTVTVTNWIDDDHFVGIVEHPRMGKSGCYGWSKGAGFFIYKISDGHIEKLGSLKRDTFLVGVNAGPE